jgi:modulator of FtsH protease
LTAYSPEHWTDLFVAAAGASAALAGLVFVAVSINVERILRLAGVPQRALETILLLLGVVVVSIFALVPGQSRIALGAELAGEGVVSLIAIALLFRASVRAAGRTGEPRYYLLSHFASAVPGAALLVVGAASLLAHGGGGLYWTMAGVVFSLVGAVLNAWVLLVEILR